MRMNLREADLAPELELNEIIWRSVRGANSPMPPPRRAAFVKVEEEEEEEDDEAEEERERLERASRENARRRR